MSDTITLEGKLTSIAISYKSITSIYLSIDEIENYYYLKIRCPILIDEKKLDLYGNLNNVWWNDTIISQNTLENTDFLSGLVKLYLDTIQLQNKPLY